MLHRDPNNIYGPISVTALNEAATTVDRSSAGARIAGGSVDGLALARGIELNAEFRAAIHLIAVGTPLTFITGAAGTGKSTLVNLLKELLEVTTAVVAPTGRAALHVGGRTINSFFGLPYTPLDPKSLGPLSGKRAAVLRSLGVLIVDEVSMVRVDVMEAICHRLRECGPDRNDPLGGIQVVLVGDLFQLPPIVKPGPDSDYIKHNYDSEFFFSAPSLQKLSLMPVELVKPYRQEDPRFLRILKAVREGEHLDAAVSELSHKCYSAPPREGRFVTLTTTNQQADDENRARLRDLPGAEMTYEGRIEGLISQSDEHLPSPLFLHLKNGAFVMFTKNDPEHRWVNGTLGVVADLSEERIAARVLSRYSGETTYDVRREEWVSCDYEYDPASRKLVVKERGKYVQFPLMLAWAVTIHKAQGATLDRAFVDLGHGAFAAGQTYVALSRCRRMEDLRLARPLTQQDVRWSDSISRFYGAMRQGRVAGAGSGGDAIERIGP